MRVVMADDMLTYHILGVIPKDMTPEDEVAFVPEIAEFCGFPCAVFEID